MLLIYVRNLIYLPANKTMRLSIVQGLLLLLLVTVMPAGALETSIKTSGGLIDWNQQQVTKSSYEDFHVTPDMRAIVDGTEEILEARARSAAAVANAAKEADQKRSIIDFQKLVYPLDRVDGGSYTNQTPFVTWVKGERSDQVYPVPPGVTYPWAIDGFADPVHRPGHVYKVIDGLHMYYELVEGKPAIDFAADGGLRFVPGYAIAQSLKGGWRDESWHDEIRSQTDHGWDKLFAVSRLNLASVL